MTTDAPQSPRFQSAHRAAAWPPALQHAPACWHQRPARSVPAPAIGERWSRARRTGVHGSERNRWRCGRPHDGPENDTAAPSARAAADRADSYGRVRNRSIGSRRRSSSCCCRRGNRSNNNHSSPSRRHRFRVASTPLAPQVTRGGRTRGRSFVAAATLAPALQAQCSAFATAAVNPHKRQTGTARHKETISANDGGATITPTRSHRNTNSHGAMTPTSGPVTTPCSQQGSGRQKEDARTPQQLPTSPYASLNAAKSSMFLR